jgi:hypothetical protein
MSAVVGPRSNCQIQCLGLVVATLVGSHVDAAPIVSVNAGTNGTTGWTFSNTSGSGFDNGNFIGAAGSTSMGQSWGLYARNGNTASQTYSFAAALNSALGQSVLPVGGTVQIDVSLGFLDTNAVVGIGLQNSSGVNRFETYYRGGSPTNAYKLNDAGGEENITGANTSFAASSWPSGNNNFQTILFTQLAGNAYSLSFDGVAVTNSNLTLAASDISQIRFFDFNSGATSNNDQFANNLVVVPEPTWTAFSVTGMIAVAVAARRMRAGRCVGVARRAGDELRLSQR